MMKSNYAVLRGIIITSLEGSIARMTTLLSFDNDKELVEIEFVIRFLLYVSFPAGCLDP